MSQSPTPNSKGPSDLPLVGLWADPNGILHWARRGPEQEQCITGECDYVPFCWTVAEQSEFLGEWRALTGDCEFSWSYRPKSSEVQKAFQDEAKTSSLPLLQVRPSEQCWLLESGNRLYSGLGMDEIRRCQLDIETRGTRGFPNPTVKEDRILAIGLQQGAKISLIELEEDSDEGEKKLLARFQATLLKWDPDVIEGHNLFRFDLNYLRERARLLRMPCRWGRFGQRASFRRSRIRIAERWIDYPRCDIPGRAIFDTWLMIQIWDLGERSLSSYGLKEVSRELGLTRTKDDRTYLPGEEINATFEQDRELFRDYLRDDLRETEALAGFLLPTYVSQVGILPMTLQEATLRGTAAKVDLLLLERYHRANHSIPEVTHQRGSFEGGFSRSFQTGRFEKVLHFDVASLYPSILLHLRADPERDPLGAFLPLLEELRELRLRYKQLARESAELSERREYQARQTSYKILINSFYGYLGFPEARFGDGGLAAQVTATGRELLQTLISKFERLGTPVLEADTDGLYVHAPSYFEDPERLLATVQEALPKGIELEVGGAYEAMLCYKAKNYALRSGDQVITRGSALRSRGMEPFLKELTEQLIHWLLGLDPVSPKERIAELRKSIQSGQIPVIKLCRAEHLSMGPTQYRSQVTSGKKNRRASLEAALQLDPLPGMGDLVRYYLTTADKASAPDWQRAVPLDRYHPEERPPDPACYLKRLDEWEKRYSEFLGGGHQEELALDL